MIQYIKTAEIEEHLLISCPKYIDIMEKLFQKTLEIEPLFNNFEPVDKMCFHCPV